MGQCLLGESTFVFSEWLECLILCLCFRWGSGSNSLQFIVPPIDALTSFVGSSVKITSSLSNDLNAGPKAARGKDAAFVFVNAYVVPRHSIILRNLPHLFQHER